MRIAVRVGVHHPLAVEQRGIAAFGNGLGGALFTWLTGLYLLFALYYHGGIYFRQDADLPHPSSQHFTQVARAGDEFTRPCQHGADR